jgi:hypothetical protein
MCGAACSLHCILASGGTGVAMHPLVQGLLPVRCDRRRAAPSTVGGGRSPACERLPPGDGYEPLQQLLVEHNNAPYGAVHYPALPATGRPHLPLAVVTETPSSTKGGVASYTREQEKGLH